MAIVSRTIMDALKDLAANPNLTHTTYDYSLQITPNIWTYMNYMADGIASWDNKQVTCEMRGEIEIYEGDKFLCYSLAHSGSILRFRMSDPRPQPLTINFKRIIFANDINYDIVRASILINPDIQEEKIGPYTLRKTDSYSQLAHGINASVG